MPTKRPVRAVYTVTTLSVTLQTVPRCVDSVKESIPYVVRGVGVREGYT